MLILIQDVAYRGITGDENELHVFEFTFKGRKIFAYFTVFEDLLMFHRFENESKNMIANLFSKKELNKLISTVFSKMIKK